jgi:acetyl-CoA C-acetyltransferase
MTRHGEESSICVLGTGLTPVGEHWDTSIRELALRAIEEARAQCPTVRPEAFYVANMLGPALSGQTQLGALLADFAGLRGLEAMTVEAAGASGGAALRQAYLAMRSGQIQSALVIGVEKVTDRIGPQVNAALATTTDADYEAVQGITPTTQAALLMRRYLHEFDLAKDALAGFSLTAHSNATTNPNAMYRRAISYEQYQRAPLLSDPMNLFDAAPIADGAGALILIRTEALPQSSELPPVRILASSISTSAVALHDQPDPLILAAAHDSAAKAFQHGQVTPEDVDLFELHDQFSVLAALSLEAAGFADQGKGWQLAADGHIQRQGKIPICTFGGSKARGDAGGATGVIQAVEVVRQLQGIASDNQVENARIGMAQCLGGVGGTAATHIFAQFQAN